MTTPVTYAVPCWQQWLADLAEQGMPFNLLQAEFRPQLSNPIALRWWWVAGSLLAVCLFVAIGSQVWQFMNMQSEQQQLQQRIGHLYQQIFPGKPMHQLSQPQIARLFSALAPQCAR